MAILDWKLCRQASIRWKALKTLKPFLCIFLKDIQKPVIAGVNSMFYLVFLIFHILNT